MIGKTATQVYTEDGTTNVIYHGTKVVSFNKEAIELNSGGHRSATTKKRMNETSATYDLGFNVYQLQGEWYITFKNETFLFKDYIVLNRNWKPRASKSFNYFDCVRDAE